MKRTDLQGQWYCDALPSGAFVAVPFDAGGVIKTAHGWTWLPGQPIERLLYVALAPDGVQFAGVGNTSDRAWRWDGQQWHDHGLAFGPQAVLFDNRNRLMVVTQPPAHGWRYIDANGQPVTCTETYHDPDRQIWEYIDFGDLVIAQGGGEIGLGDDPLIALYQGRRILIQRGRCRFIKARRDGNNLALAWVQEDTGAASILWLTLSELLTFPDVSSVPSNPSQPTPPPQNPNTPPMPNIPDQIDRVRAIRARLYPDMVGKPLNDHGKAFQITKTLAWELRDLGFGLVAAKPGSDNNVEGYTADIVALQDGQHWDVLGSVETEATPAWGKVGDEHNAAIVPRWRPPVAPTGGDDGDPGDEDPTPAPVPQPPVCNCAALQAQIDALTDRVVQLETQPDADLDAKIAAKLDAKLKEALADVARVGYPVRVNLTLSATLRGKIEKP